MTLYERLGCPEFYKAPHEACRSHHNAYAISNCVIWIDGEFWFVPGGETIDGPFYSYTAAYRVRPVTKVEYERVH